MALNAKTRAFTRLLNTVKDKSVSQIAYEVFGLKALQTVTGKKMDDHLPQCEKHYSATEVGEMFGITANKIGKIANANDLKTEEYGIYVLDKSPYSAKEVSAFRYNEKAIEKFRGLLC